MEKIDRKHKEELMDIIRKAGDPDNYETSWDEAGRPISKKKTDIKRGKSSRARGARFENKVREWLEKEGWIVAKWTNNVELLEEPHA